MNQSFIIENSRQKLPRCFYERSPLEVARDLLGKCIVHNSKEGVTIGKIVETEAYMGIKDPACHTYKGRRTPRTELLYGSGGYLYIYLIYGMYLCFNVVAEKEGIPGAAFIRAMEPIEGLELMAKRRGFKTLTQRNLVNLTNGPGKLSIAMGVTTNLYGTDLCAHTLFLTYGEKIPSRNIIETSRINIDYAGEAKEYPWRFVIRDSKFLSVKK